MKEFRAHALRWSLWTVTAALIGCGDDGVASTLDAGDDGWVVAEPAAPALVELRCPTGWRPVQLGTDPQTCEPWPASGRASCAAGELHLPGTPGCTAIGPTCPTGDYAPDLPASGVLYVRADALAGDGTVSNPFGAISEATAVASSGTVIALAPGDYNEPVVLPLGVELRGACVAAVKLHHTSSSPGAALVSLGDGSTLRNATLTGDAAIGVSVARGAAATIEHAEITNASVNGILLQPGAQLTAQGLSVRACGNLDDPEATAVLALADARLTLSRSVLRDNVGDAVGARDGARAVLSEVGAWNHVGAERDRGGQSGNGVGLMALNGGQLDATSCVIEQAERSAVWAFGEGSVVRLEDTVLRDTRVEQRGSFNAFGVFTQNGALVQLESTLIERVGRAGVRASGGRAVLIDVVVRDVAPQTGTGTWGYGVHGGRTASIEATRVALLRTHHAALFAGLNTSVTAQDLSISQVYSQTGSAISGHGISMGLGSTAVIRRAVVRHARESGIALYGTGAVHLEDVVVREGLGRELDGTLGAGITVSGAPVTMERVLMDDNPRVGLWVGQSGSVSGSDIRIRRTRPQDCAQDSCSDIPFGMGLGTYQFARVQLNRFSIEDSTLCGLQLATDGVVDLKQGEVTRSRIGACVQNEGYDVNRLSDDVSYLENDANLQAVTLPVPDAAPPVAGSEQG